MLALRPRPDDETPAARERRISRVDAAFGDLLEAVIEADAKDQALANAIRIQLGKEPVRLALPSHPQLSG
jgi:hypothetical protein